MKKTCGINIGSSSVKVAVLDSGRLVFSAAIAHEGDVRRTLNRILHQASVKPGIRTLVTGNEGRKQIRVKGVIEAVALQETLRLKGIQCQAVVAMGGEDLVVYVLDEQYHIRNSFSGNKCASGTGEFFKQQLKRMNLDLDEGLQLAAAGARVHKISSRCSVFMKSDCTHKLNKGEASKGDIVLSLSRVMADKVVEFLKKAKIFRGRVVLTGGLTQNQSLVDFLRESMPGVDFDIPDYARIFEALGAASLAATQGEPLPEEEKLYTDEHVSYDKMSPLVPFRPMVTYMQPHHGTVQRGREYILGIDGGSTTTKVALIDRETDEIVASYYGRTHGDPVKALKGCLGEIRKEIIDAIGSLDVKISLAATTGSSREILGVFMETTDVYNEIIAHTVGTTYFDPGIDTIFEIGGQDAKYVYLKNKVPIDYAMNEACSAGTGSFLEESAKGDLNIESASEIGTIAEQANAPLKFGEHCSAFINSDIRKAIQEGASKYNIVAGLIYSVVLNYLNRVVGNRTIGNKIVLQGGVAKNSAVPLAFAALVKKNIVIPPDPELMGCFGVGMLAKQKAAAGLLEKSLFNLDEALEREIVYEGEIVCRSCDNFCPIRKLKVGPHRYFFGGRCNKYANIRKKAVGGPPVQDLVQVRHDMLYQEFAADFSGLADAAVTVGIPHTFSVHSLWPLYSHFFRELGVNVFLSEQMDKDGLDKMNAPFCFPGEIAHAMMETVIKRGCDYYFVPHFKDAESMQADVHACLCPIVQGLPYYLRSAFRIPAQKLLAPVISFKNGFHLGRESLLDMAQQMGFSAAQGEAAFAKGVAQMKQYWQRAQEIGRQAVERINASGQRAIVLFGRPYNAFTWHANMGLPKKFTSRGYTVIPFDFLPIENADIYENMYWYFGQQNLRVAVNIAPNRNLYLCYISNFSCAPDSFILHYLRWIHGSKPFLVLELDSHTADAGVDTRVEAFLDIIEGYVRSGPTAVGTQFNRRYDIKIGTDVKVVDSVSGEKIDLRDRRVRLLLPSMGHESSQALGTVINRYGINTEILPVADRNSVQLARNVASGKECIPCLLVLGSFIKYFNENRPDPNLIYVLFMPITTGPCRTGQYAVFYDRILREYGYQNIAVLKLNSDNSYNEVGVGFSRLAWYAICTGDALKDLKSGVRVCLKNPADGMALIAAYWKEMLDIFARGNLARDLTKKIAELAEELARLPRSRPVETIRKVLVVGEIFVRRDDYSVQTLVDHLTEWGILVKISGLSEWINYLDWMRKHSLKKTYRRHSWLQKSCAGYYLKHSFMKLELAWKKNVKHRIEQAFAISGILPAAPEDMKRIMRRAAVFSSPDFETEATLSPSVAAEAMQDGYSGVVIIAPFACLPGRLIEAVYAPWARERNLPVLALETDGNVYPPNIVAKINIFSLNVNTLTKNKESKRDSR
jgi:predicted CoA-substrate-specific enzyme activase